MRASEEVLVVVDGATRAIGEALRDGGRERGADAVLAVMDERETDGSEPPRSDRGRAARLRRVHRPHLALAQPHERAQAGERARRTRRDDARA